MGAAKDAEMKETKNNEGTVEFVVRWFVRSGTDSSKVYGTTFSTS
jgi:hypothetical protein